MNKLELMTVLISLDVLLKAENLEGAQEVVTRLLTEANSKTQQEEKQD